MWKSGTTFFSMYRCVRACSGSSRLMIHLNSKSLSFRLWCKAPQILMYAAKHKTKSILISTFISICWQHLPWGLRDLLAGYVGQHPLIIMVLSGVTDTHISIYINKWNRVGIQMMYHKVWMMSDKKCTASAEERELVGDRQARGAGTATQNKLNNRSQQSPCLRQVNLTSLNCLCLRMLCQRFSTLPLQCRKREGLPIGGFNMRVFKGVVAGPWI